MNLTLLPSTAWPPHPLRSVGPAPASAGPAVDVLDDAALMARYRDGDEHAFRRLYECHRGALYRYVLRLAGDRSEADELFQDVWIAVIRGRERYVPNARFVTYLFSIAHRRAADRWRRRFRDDERFDPMPSEAEPDSAEIGGADQPLAPDSIPETETWNAQRAEALQAAIQTLPLPQREAFLLRAEAGMSLEEIARVTGIDPEAAKSRLRYAVRKLRLALGDWQ